MSGPSDADRYHSLPDADTLPAHLTRLALPVLGEQLLIFAVDLYDVFLSGQLGPTETTAIGLAAYVAWMASLIFDLVRVGVAALVARAWGSGEFDGAQRVLARSLWLGGVLSVAVFTLLQLLAPSFAWLMGLVGPAHDIAVHYLRWDALGQVFACVTAICAAGLRGTGDTRTPLAVLSLTNVVNVILATGLVYGWGPLPQLGVSGIVFGSLAAKASGMVAMLAALSAGVTWLQLNRRDICWHRETAERVLRIGGPAALDGLLKFSGHFLFVMVIAHLPSHGLHQVILAAHFIGVRVEALSYLPAQAWGMAAASLAGRLLGATSPDVALQTGKIAVRQYLWYPVLITAVFFFGADTIYRAMHTDPEVARAGVAAFRLMALYQVPNAFLIIYFNTLIGAGDTRFPMWCSLWCSLGVRVPVAYLCGVTLEGGLFGAWIGMGADNLIRAALMSWRYHAGRWVYTRV